MSKELLESYLSGNLYYMSLYRCAYQTKALFPDIYALLDNNCQLFGDDARLSQLLFEDKKKINARLNELMQEAHFDYFRYLKDSQGKIKVILEVENFVTEIDPHMNFLFLEMMYNVQEDKNHHDYFRKVNPRDNDTIASNYPTFDYSFETWWDHEDKIDHSIGVLETVLEKKDVDTNMTMFDYISSYRGEAKQKKLTLES